MLWAWWEKGWWWQGWMMRGCKKWTLSPRACGLLRFGKGINTKERSQKYAQSLKMGGGVLEHLQANYLIDIMKTRPVAEYIYGYYTKNIKKPLNVLFSHQKICFPHSSRCYLESYKLDKWIFMFYFHLNSYKTLKHTHHGSSVVCCCDGSKSFLTCCVPKIWNKRESGF